MNPVYLKRPLLLATLALAAVSVAWTSAAGAATITRFSIPTADSDPESIIAGPDGALYFGEQNAYKVGRIDTSGNISEFAVPDNAQGVGDAGPRHLASSGGYIWLTTDTGETIYRMAPTGQLSLPFRWDGSFAFGLGAASSGGVWVYDQTATDSSGRPDQIQRIDPDGTVTAFNTDDMNQSFEPMTLGPDGSAWYTEESGSAQYLNNITNADAQTKFPIPTADATYDVTSLAFSRNGTLWFTEHAPYDYSFPVGGAVGELAPGSSAPQITWSIPDNQDVGPTSLTAGPNGVMYFSYATGSGTDGGIGMISPSGQVTLQSTAPYKPDSVAYGSDGNLWFVDSTANVVGEVSPSDLFAGVAGGGGSGGSGGGSGGGATTPTPTTTTPVSTTPTTVAPIVTKKAPAAPAPSLIVPRQKLSKVRGSGKLVVSCALAGAGTCAVQAKVKPAVARQLKLKVPKSAKLVPLAKASHSFTKKDGGKATLTLKLSAGVRRALKRDRTLSLLLAVSTTAKGDSARHLTRAVRLSG